MAEIQMSTDLARLITTILPISLGGTGKNTGAAAFNNLATNIGNATGDFNDTTYFITTNNNGATDDYYRRGYSILKTNIKTYLTPYIITSITYDGTGNALTSLSLSDAGVLTATKATYNNYSHPTSDGNKHVPATGTTSDGKVLVAGSTAGSFSWKSLADAGIAAASHGTHVSYGTSTAKIGTTAAAGTASTVSRSDHVHAIDLATGDANGQVKIAGTNVSVKGLAALAYKASSAWSEITSRPADAGSATRPVYWKSYAASACDFEIATYASGTQQWGIRYYGAIGGSGSAYHSDTVDTALIMQDTGLFLYKWDSAGTNGTLWSFTKDSDGKINGDITGSSGSCRGNAATATKFNSTRKIELTGSVTGSATTDGSSGWTIATTTNHTHSYIPLSGSDAITGNLKINTKARGLFLTDSSNNQYGAICDNGSNLWVGSYSSDSRAHTGKTYINAGWNESAGNSTIYIFVPSAVTGGGTSYAAAHSGNVGTGDSNGQIKIAGTNVSVKGLGSAAYTASTAYATSGHNHDSTYLKLSGGTMTGTIFTQNVTPKTDATYTLGTLTARWTNVCLSNAVYVSANNTWTGNSDLAHGAGTAMYAGRVELTGATGPYIDFKRCEDTAATDYNVRVINDAKGRLSIYCNNTDAPSAENTTYNSRTIGATLRVANGCIYCSSTIETASYFMYNASESVPSAERTGLYIRGANTTKVRIGITTTGRGTIWLYDENANNLYLQPRNNDTYFGSTAVTLLFCSQYFAATKVANAVWNDYAEYRAADIITPGYCVIETSKGIMTKANKRLLPGAKIISDTYGTIMGKTKDAQTPIAVAGRVLVYTYQDRNNYSLGACVCTAPDGTVDIMTREEIMMYPDCIVGTVSEIPNYEIWNCGSEECPEKVQVNGRIWVYVR